MPLRRLDQTLSSLGYCSRKEIAALLKEQRITVNGSVPKDSGLKVAPDSVLVDGSPLDHPDGILILLHKPLGVVCSHDAKEGPSVYDLLPARWKKRNPVLTTVGRLDKETSGLLLLTDQSLLVHRLTSPKHKVPKTYLATLDRSLSLEERPNLVASFASGDLLLTGETTPCAPASLSFTAPDTAQVILTEGRYHQVRRMFVACGLTVTKLHRNAFGPLALDSLQPGEWRDLPLNYFDPKPAP